MENSREKQLEDLENYFSRMKKNFKVYHVPLKELKEFILFTLYQNGGMINRGELDRKIKRHFDIDDKIDIRDGYNRALGNLRRINKVKKIKGDRDNVS